MVEITNHEELQAWLKGKPRNVAALIAVRAALRAAPFLNAAGAGGNEYADRLILMSFRALSIAWTCIAGNNKGVVGTTKVAADAANVAADAANVAADAAHARGVALAANAAASKAAYAAYATYARPAYAKAAAVAAITDAAYAKATATANVAAGDAYAKGVAVATTTDADADDAYVKASYASDGAAKAGYIVADNWTWRQLSHDMTLLERGPTLDGKSVGDLIEQPLYRSDDVGLVQPVGQGLLGGALLGGPLLGPSVSPSSSRDDWGDFRSYLEEKNQNWDIWIDWYKDRLAGRSQNRVFEKALLALTKEEWKKHPAVVNARMKELMEEFQPDEVGLSFGASQTTASQVGPVVIPASDRLVSARHNQEPFDRLEKSLDEIRDEFARDHNKQEYLKLQRPALLFAMQTVLDQIKTGWVKFGDLRDRLRPELMKLAEDCEALGKIGATLLVVVGGAIAAVTWIINLVG